MRGRTCEDCAHAEHARPRLLQGSCVTNCCTTRRASRMHSFTDWSLREAARGSCTRALPARGPDEGGGSDALKADLDAPGHYIARGGVAISAGTTLVARAYDFSRTEWALVFVDGRFTGSPHATRYLALYAPDGSLLHDESVQRLRLSAEQAATLLATSLASARRSARTTTRVLPRAARHKHSAVLARRACPSRSQVRPTWCALAATPTPSARPAPCVGSTMAAALEAAVRALSVYPNRQR